MFDKQKQNLPVKLEAFKWRLASLATCYFHTYMPCTEANSNISLVTKVHHHAGAGTVKCRISRKATNNSIW